jgi:hypothetical protein
MATQKSWLISLTLKITMKSRGANKNGGKEKTHFGPSEQRVLRFTQFYGNISLLLLRNF